MEGTTGEDESETVAAAVGDATAVDIEDASGADEDAGSPRDWAESCCGAITNTRKRKHTNTKAKRDAMLPYW